MERPHPQPEYLPLRYPDGWREILQAPDAADYQMWLTSLTELTQQQCQELANVPEWAHDPQKIAHRWQYAIEQVARAAVDPYDELTEPERIETALLTVQANIEGMGWEQEGLVFIIPNITTGDALTIDLRELELWQEVNGD